MRETMGDQEKEIEVGDGGGEVPPTLKGRWLNAQGGQKGMRKVLSKTPELEVPGGPADPGRGDMKMI